MTEQTKRIKRKRKIYTTVVVVALLSVYGVTQWYLINRNKIETVKATEGFINDSIMTTGVVCREETVLESTTDGFVFYNVENGQRVSSGMLIGEVYPSVDDIDLINKSNDIKQQLLKLEEAENFMSTVNIDISITRKQLSNSMVELSHSVVTGNYDDIYNSMMDVSLHINKINTAMDRNDDIASTKQELINLNNDINGRISDPLVSISSPTSGYFMDSVDGYENVITKESFENMSYEEGLQVLNTPVESSKSGVYGKVITNYKWHLCAYVTQKQAEKLSNTKKVRLSLDTEQNQYQNAEIEKIIPKDNMYLVVLKSSTIDKSSVSNRINECEILFSQYKGIKVPKSALRIVGGEMGVYIKFAKLVQFKKVSPIYQDDNYVILPINTSDENQVELYDDIIVKGVNLYDGKYL